MDKYAQHVLCALKLMMIMMIMMMMIIIIVMMIIVINYIINGPYTI